LGGVSVMAYLGWVGPVRTRTRVLAMGEVCKRSDPWFVVVWASRRRAVYGMGRRGARFAWLTAAWWLLAA